MAVKVRQRDGKWWVFIDYKRKRKAKCIGDSLKTAKLFAEKMEAALLLGQFDLNKDETKSRPFDTYFTNWLNTYAKAHCKPSTVERYQRTFRLYLSPTLKNKDLGTISREDVKKLVYGLVNTGQSRNSIKAVLTPLIELFNHAVEDGHVSVNPAMRVLKRSHTEDSRKGKADFLTREELSVLLSTCHAHFPGYYPFVLLLARTGLRLGEAIALQWGDIDFHGRFLEVQRAFSGPHLSTPKNGKTRRVDMSLQLTETLKACLVERKAETLRKGWGEVPLWVFLSEEGTPYNRGNFRWRIWYKLLEKAGLRRIRIHDVRHTFASLLLQNGESLVYVKEQMGHHSIQLTVDTYGHLIPGGNRAAVDRLDGPEPATVRNPSATTLRNEVSTTQLAS
jgi:integrase